MALTEYEELVMTELEAEFAEPPSPRPSPGRLATLASCFLAGAGLLVAAHQAGLIIRISDVFGFSTGSVTSALSVAGHAVLLAWAFVLGQVVFGLRHQCPDGVVVERLTASTPSSERV